MAYILSDQRKAANSLRVLIDTCIVKRPSVASVLFAPLLGINKGLENLVHLNPEPSSIFRINTSYRG